MIVTYQDLNILMDSNPAEIDNSNFPITPIDSLRITGSPPEVDISKYVLSVDGSVETPLSLSYDAILQYPAITEVVLLVCPEYFVDNVKWTGVPVNTLLEEAGVKNEASHVTFSAMDGYNWTFSLEDVLQNDIFLAYKVNDQTLPLEHGYPIRLVLKGHYGSEWIKWVDHIEVR